MTSGDNKRSHVRSIRYRLKLIRVIQTNDKKPAEVILDVEILEIDRNKAETLARRFGLAWGIEISAVPAPFSRDAMYRDNLGTRYSNSSMPVFITCVRARVEHVGFHNIGNVDRAFALDDLPEKWAEFTQKNAAYYGR